MESPVFECTNLPFLAYALKENYVAQFTNDRFAFYDVSHDCLYLHCSCTDIIPVKFLFCGH